MSRLLLSIFLLSLISHCGGKDSHKSNSPGEEDGQEDGQKEAPSENPQTKKPQPGDGDGTDGTNGATPFDDAGLLNMLGAAGIRTPEPKEFLQGSEAVYLLGQKLFFDSYLSGDGRTSCGTCHNPRLGTGDGLSLRPAQNASQHYWRQTRVGGNSAGVVAEDKNDEVYQAGTGQGRLVTSALLPRNVPPIYYRGHESYTQLFWDSRVSEFERLGAHGHQIVFQTPVGRLLPRGLQSPLAAQALFPLLACEEMRGCNNRSIVPANARPDQVWRVLASRLKQRPGYRQALEAAYPGKAWRAVGIVEMANALAVYQSMEFGKPSSDLDRYLAGDKDAMSAREKAGALLFLGKAQCVRCHGGPLLTDHAHHNAGFPQIGPGPAKTGFDLGWGGFTGRRDDRFTFRTPSLRNVATTAPYAHNGAYTSLTAVVEHYNAPAPAWEQYSLFNLSLLGSPTAYRGLWGAHRDADIRRDLLSGLDVGALGLNGEEVSQLVEFLHTLTDTTAKAQ